MKKTLNLLLAIMITVPALAQESTPEACTVFIAGKNTTVDGSILFVKTEDDSRRDIDYLWYVPRRNYAPGAIVKLEAGGEIPQVQETFAYFWDECPGTSFSNGLINEWGVAFGSNGCRSKEDAVEAVAARGDLINGGLGFELRMIMAERAKTAREAVLLAAKLIDTYGYSASGRNLNIVDSREAWQLQMVRGKKYVARRVQDDEVAIIANTFSIREVDTNDSENFICSPALIDYAIARGWYDPGSGEEFDFARAYAPESVHTSPSNTHRQWNLARLLDTHFPVTWEDAERGILPAAVRPGHKLSLQEAVAIVRDHYEGTPLDESGGYGRSPHKTRSTICNYGTHRTTVIQLRSSLPAEIGTVIWRALDTPCTSVFVPWYLGVRKIPQVYHHAAESFYETKKEVLEYHFTMPERTWLVDPESASGIFRILGEFVDGHYAETISIVQKTWREFEEFEFALQPTIEESAKQLYRTDGELGSEYLSLYTNAQALKAVEVAQELAQRLSAESKRSSGETQKFVKIDWEVQHSGTSSNLRGICAVSANVAWASGSNGTYLRTSDGGRNWLAGRVPGAFSLDFRDVHAADADTALLLCAGLPAKIYKTTDGGANWRENYCDTTPGVFFNSMAFWNDARGIAISDPIDGKFHIILTGDGGESWQPVPAAGIPAAIAGEVQFAASGTCLAVHGEKGVWFGTGGAAARLFRSDDGGRTWNMRDTPVISGEASAGIFSVAIIDAEHGVIVGGDYRREDQAVRNAACTSDGGASWSAVEAAPPSGYRSCVAVVLVTAAPILITVGPSGSDVSRDMGVTWAQLDSVGYHSISFARAEGTGWSVGANGKIARVVCTAR